MNNIPTHMKAIVIEEAGAPALLRIIPVPTPRSNQVLIKVDSSPINPSDILFIQSIYGIQKPFPTVAGFEGAGVIVT